MELAELLCPPGTLKEDTSEIMPLACPQVIRVKDTGLIKGAEVGTCI